MLLKNPKYQRIARGFVAFLDDNNFNKIYADAIKKAFIKPLETVADAKTIAARARGHIKPMPDNLREEIDAHIKDLEKLILEDAETYKKPTLEQLEAASKALLNSSDFQVEDTSHLDATTRNAARNLALLLGMEWKVEEIEEETLEDYDRPTYHLCGDCGTVEKNGDHSDDNGYCKCGADNWIERGDFTNEDLGKKWLKEKASALGLTVDEMRAKVIPE